MTLGAPGRWLARVVLLMVGVAAFGQQAPETPAKFSAQHRRWWAIQPVQKPAVPTVQDRAWARNEVDAFVLAKLEARQIRPNPPADRITLLRRITLDLTGLPPTAEEMQAFLGDTSPHAWEAVVDRLLASPRYGERWARHWLDVARYADSEGFKLDETRPNIWRYRDYVIQALNADKPYDRFVREQIAGDELYPGNPEALVATGFNRHFADESNAAHLMLRRQELLNDITDTVSATFLGITAGCARCHDHKFDPILHKDYYRLQAFFANTRIEDNAVLDGPAQRRLHEQQYAAWDEQTRDIRRQMEAILKPRRDARYQERLTRFPDDIQAIITMPAAQRTPYQWQMYTKALPQITFNDAEFANALKGDAAQRYKELQAELAKFDVIKPAPLSIAQVMVDHSAEAPVTRVLNGGAWDAPLDEVQPGFLTILDANPAKITPPAGLNSTGRRAALANWLADPANPLSTRVIVNRVWHHHFGRGIVGTPSDFGTMGERPTHRELLDWLTTTFVHEDGWSLKKLHRRILVSNAYRQSSANQEIAAKADPDNKLLWRFPRRRLEGETIRDAMLAVSGHMNLAMGGPGVFPPLPAGVAPNKSYPFWRVTDDPAQANRRSVYVFVRRNLRYPLFEAFDMPDTHEPCSRRAATVTPTQSLALMNDELVLEWARSLAGRVLDDAGLTPAAQVERAYRLAYQRPPTDVERERALRFLERHQPILAERAAQGTAPPVPDRLPSGIAPLQAAAMVDLCHALLNANEFLYLN